MKHPNRIRHARALVLRTLLLIAGVALCATPGHAVPALLNYQGYLTDGANAPLAGNHAMIFRLYADSTTGAPAWSESYAAVKVTAGVFNVVLGSTSSLPVSAFNGATLWLQTTVDGVDILPRRPILSVAYALHAAFADSAAQIASSAGSITGHVNIGCTTTAGVGVLVYVPGRSFIAYTNSTGDFTLGSVPPGTYALHVESSNPAGATDVANVVVAAGGTTSVGPVMVAGNLATAPQNCGTCGNVCSYANATGSCAAGACGIGSCNAGYGNCDYQAANGCETNVNTSAGNCGACGNVCAVANGTSACVSGTCAVGSCNTGYANCDAQAANGCETNVNTNPSNCGTCGHVCSFANASANCAAGTCQLGGCYTGYASCDGNTANGCETDTRTDPANCGGCHSVCVLPHTASNACAAGTCQVGSCSAGYANCDSVASNGCETDLNTSTSNCGTCGNVCPSGHACVAGACQ